MDQMKTNRFRVIMVSLLVEHAQGAFVDDLGTSVLENEPFIGFSLYRYGA
jgi:hypothetical protein